jgi:hypothetical protein
LLFDSIDECRLQGRCQQDSFKIVLQKIKNDLRNQQIRIPKLNFIFMPMEVNRKKDIDG